MPIHMEMVRRSPAVAAKPVWWRSLAIGLVIVLDQLMFAMERQKLFGETALGGTLLVYPKEVRAQALREAKKMREGGQVVQMMRKSSKKEIEEYVAYVFCNGNGSLIYLTKDGEKQQMIEAI